MKKIKKTALGGNVVPFDRKEFDVVLVAYDMAYNRLEYHMRFSYSNDAQEDASLTVQYAKSEVNDLDFTFRFSELAVLKNAEYLELGLVISESTGYANLATKFKYVFDEGCS